MNYLEEYLREHNCTMADFHRDQEDVDGFCPRDIGVDGSCPCNDCDECWRREVDE